MDLAALSYGSYFTLFCYHFRILCGFQGYYGVIPLYSVINFLLPFCSLNYADFIKHLIVFFFLLFCDMEIDPLRNLAVIMAYTPADCIQRITVLC